MNKNLLNVQERLKLAEIISQSKVENIPHILNLFSDELDYKNVPESIVLWCQTKDRNYFINKITEESYQDYVEFCAYDMELKPESKIAFSKFIISEFSLKTKVKRISGDLKRIYIEG